MPFVLRFKKILSKKDYRVLIENFFSLSVLNIINYLFPLILIPYLTRVLGVEKYGLYAFAFAIINYFVMLVNYGFDFSATKQVAIIRDEKETLNRLFSTVTTVRIMLAAISVLFLFIIVFLVDKLSSEKELIFSGIGIIISAAFIPVWFFQGLENMKLVTVVNFITRLLSTLLIFLFVKEQQDYKLALSFQSLGYLAGGVFSMILSFTAFKIKFAVPSLKELVFQIKDGWHIFLSTLGMNFYRESNTIILGFLTNFSIVGYYAAAEKLIKAIQSLTAPFVNVLFPYFGRRLNVGENIAKNMQLYKKLGVFYGILLLTISVMVLVLAPWGIKSYLSVAYISSVTNVQIMCMVIFFGGLNYYYGIIGLVNMGKEKLFAKAVWISGIFSVCICFLLSAKLLDKGASVAMVLAEFLLFIQILFYSKNGRTTRGLKTSI